MYAMYLIMFWKCLRLRTFAHTSHAICWLFKLLVVLVRSGLVLGFVLQLVFRFILVMRTLWIGFGTVKARNNTFIIIQSAFQPCKLLVEGIHRKV